MNNNTMSSIGQRIIVILSLIMVFSGNSFANIIVLNGLTQEFNGLPGETYKGIIEVKNLSESEHAVRIYQKDYFYSFDGITSYNEPGQQDRSNASWIVCNPVYLTVPGGEVAMIEYEVTIPEVDTLDGSYWSVVMVEGIKPIDTSNYSRGVNIQTLIRYAVQVVTNIGETGIRDLQFIGFETKVDSVNNYLSVDIINTGERLLRPEIGIELYDATGEIKGILKSEKRKIYPGTSVRVMLPLPELEKESYSGILIADCGGDYAFGTNLELNLNDQ
ncbi:MAG: hypothetical protein KKA81_13415 [Bacteroidetes bacterium]|nr:hypothetical protein [Bacteroidota bacterium]